MKHILTSAIVLICVSFLSAQTPWIQSGNNSINANTHLLGTTDNSVIPIKTNGNLRMLVTAGTGGASGQIGLGNNLATNFNPQHRLHLHQGNWNQANYIRWSNGSIGNMTGFDIGQRAIHMLDTNAAIINNRLNTPLRVFQNDIERMTFDQLDTWNGINGATGTDASRITLGYDGDNAPAWSMLHLVEGNLPNGMYRPWMNVGVSMTGNSDFLYLGMIERPTVGNILRTDMVAAWGCQDGALNSDNFRFIYMENEDTVPPINQIEDTEQGREIMRLTPTGNVGIGNFSTMVSATEAGLAQQPTHKLDVDGTARLRQMPAALPFDSSDVVVIGRQMMALGDYDLRYAPIDSLLALGDDCDWAISPQGHVVTGNFGLPGSWGPDACNQTRNVGIGTIAPYKAKLDVFLTDAGLNDPVTEIAVQARTDKKLENNYGLSASALGVGTDVISNYGGWLNGRNSPKYNYGVFARGSSETGYQASTVANYGIYADAYGSAGSNWAAYVNGSGYITSGPWQPSDQSLKSEITDVENATDMLTNVNIKSYQFNTDEYSHLNLPSGTQYGVMASEFSEIFPQFVKPAVNPPILDSLGNTIVPRTDFDAVNYSGMVPLLIRGFQEQQRLIESLEERLLAMEILVNPGSHDENDLNKSSDQSSNLRYELYQNRPNPFQDRTEIVWRMAEEASIQIMVQDVQGKPVTVLYEGISGKGLHSLEWDATDLPSGTYFYSLHVNEQLMIKRAVKIER